MRVEGTKRIGLDTPLLVLLMLITIFWLCELGCDSKWSPVVPLLFAAFLNL